MADLFRSEDVKRVFLNKFVVVIGDSVQRGVYKDLVSLLQQDRYLFEEELKKKGEFCHQNDELVEGGQRGKMTNGKDYREVRQYLTDYHLVRFYYVTRCYSRYMESILADLVKEPNPDVIIMNSCLWDVSRYGPYSMPEYKKNLQRFFHRLNEIIPSETLFIWNTTLPISNSIRGGFLLDYLAFMQATLRLDIVEANFFAAQVVMDYDRDVLDLHYNFRHLQHHRKRDGVHWNATAHRQISQLLMAHICHAWGLGLPRYNRSRSMIPAPAPSLDEQRYGGPVRQSGYMDRRNVTNRNPRQRSYSCNPDVMRGQPQSTSALSQENVHSWQATVMVVPNHDFIHMKENQNSHDVTLHTPFSGWQAQKNYQKVQHIPLQQRYNPYQLVNRCADYLQ